MNKQNIANIEQSHKGTILIVALFIITLLEIVIVGLVTFHRISIHHSRNFFSSIEATNVLIAGEDWAKKRILQSLSKNEIFITSTLAPTQINGATLAGIVNDAQGKFNINNLMKDENESASFNSFISNLFSNSETESQQLIKDIQQRVKSYQLFQESTVPIVPYTSASELRVLPGINAKNYELIAKNIIALPEATSLNLNSATAYSLLTLSPEMTMATAKSLIKIRDSMHGFSSVDTFTSLAPLGDLALNQDLITVKSQYYISTMTVQNHDVNLTLNSLLKVNINQDGPAVMVLWRSFGAI